MSQPRKHHYLPQFYLRGFSLDGRSLYQIEKGTAKYYRGQISDLAAIRDFHEIDGDDVDDPQELEKKLSRIEEQQASSLRDVLAEGLRTSTHRTDMVQFVAVMRMRVPAVKGHIDRSYQSFLRANFKALDRAGKLPIRPPGLERELQADRIQFSISNWKVLEKMFLMAGSRLSLEALSKMRFSVLRAPFGSCYITSDQPVALYHPAPLHHRRGVGPATPGVEISFPLSSRALLLLDHKNGRDVDRIASSEEVAEYNRRTIAMAQTYIFAGENIHSVSTLVKSDSGAQTGFTFDDVETDTEFLQILRFIPIGPP